MKQSDVYRENADNCVKLAEGRADEPSLNRYHRMAATWLALAHGQLARRKNLRRAGGVRGLRTIPRNIAGAVLGAACCSLTKGFEMSLDEGHGIVRDGRGEEQPADKQRAQQSSKTPAAGPHANPN